MRIRCFSGAPVTEQSSDKKEELGDLPSPVSHETLSVEKGRDEENIGTLYKLLDDKVCTICA